MTLGFFDIWGPERKRRKAKVRSSIIAKKETTEQTTKASCFADLWKGYDPRQPRWPEGHPSGGQWRSHQYPGAFADHATFSGPRMALARVRGRAFAPGGDPPRVRLGKLETGEVMEQVALAYLHQRGFKGATLLHARTPSFPVDIYEPKQGWAIEVKGGDAGNGKSAWQWRATAGEPGASTKAALLRMSADRKKAYHARVQQGLMFRKEQIIRIASQQRGRKIKPMMLTGIINAERRTVDLYVIRGFHERIGWVSRDADKAYVGTFRYSKAA